MKILAIDTSSSICSTALLEKNELIDKNELNNGRTHSENLMPLIDNLLKRNNISVKDIDLIACSVGPGSFTGIRIGLASIKAIAEVLKIKIAGVTSLETLARNVEKSNTIISLIDARNNQVYCGIFDGNYNKKEDYIADDINEVIKKLKGYKEITFVGNGAVLHKDLLIKNLDNIKFSNNNEQSAENVGKLGYKRYIENDLCDADTVLPIYLKKSQAERLKNK